MITEEEYLKAVEEAKKNLAIVDQYIRENKNKFEGIFGTYPDSKKE